MAVKDFHLQHTDGVTVAPGALTITDSTITGNSANGGNSGGGILNHSLLTMTNSTISANTNGGITTDGSATITNSNIVGNSSDQGGGITAGGTTIVTNSRITGNTAIFGGGINTSALKKLVTLTLIGTTVSGNAASNGAGINNNGSIITIRDSTIDSNGSSEPGFIGFGGGIYNLSGSVALINSTVSRNQAAIFGGIYNDGELSLVNSTVTENFVNFGDHGGGIYTNSALTIRNSIVAGNFAKVNPDIEYNGGTVTSRGNNLIGSTDTGLPVSWQPTDILDQPAQLGPLGNYGGPTQTYALTNNSPAINAGNSCVITANGCGDNNPALPVDQRGAARVDAVDIGAFERNNPITGGQYRAVTTDATVSVPFNFPITDDSGSFSYVISGGSLPPGVSLINSGGLGGASNERTARAALVPTAGRYSIAGTPSLGGSYDYTITATGGTASFTVNYRTVVFASPTAAGVEIGGRVLSGLNGLGVANVLVSLTDQAGLTRLARTNPFGAFSFADVPAGATYIVSATSKRYSFAPRVISAVGVVDDLILFPED